MGRLSSQGWDALLVQKLSVLLSVYHRFYVGGPSQGAGNEMSDKLILNHLDHLLPTWAYCVSLPNMLMLTLLFLRTVFNLYPLGANTAHHDIANGP